MKTYEYIWLDGYQPEPSMRSKVKATRDETPPEWSFDGSSTQQAEGGSSDCLLLPVQTYENPNGHDLVMTQFKQLITLLIHQILEQLQLKLSQMNGGLDLNKNTFLLILKLESHWDGKMESRVHKVHTTVLLELEMFLEEKFLMLT